MKRYEKYKPSGVEWIGDVPEGWNIKRLRFVGTSKNGLTYSPSDICEENEGILVLRSSNIQDSKLTFEDNVFVKDVPKSLMVEMGDLIICSRNGSLSLVGKCALVEDDIKATFGAFMLRLKSKINSKYTYYAVTCSISYYKGLMSTTTVNQLTVETLNNMSIPVPPLPEQNAIATYLDAKCAKIDNVVAVQQKRIELLKELKQSIITHAVTRGLDKNAKLKDSGVEWIGEMPEGWEIVKTIYCLSMPITDGPHETPVLHDDGIPFISAEAVSQGFINFDLKRGYISQQYYEECCKKYTPQKHDIYMIKSGATTGRTAIVETDEIFTIWSPLAVFRSNTNIIKPYYLLYVLRSEYYQKQVENSWSYGTQQNIGMRVLEKLKIALPPLSEQTAIATYLDKKCAIIDRQIAKVEKQIELLKEYKQSVITECVTGKRKVC